TMLDTIIFAATGHIGAIYVVTTMWAIAATNRITSTINKKLGKTPLTISHPDQIYRTCFKYGGIAFTKLGPLAFSGFGVLPLHVFLSLVEHLGLDREGADDSPDDQLQEPSQFGSNRFKDRDIKRIIGDAEAYDPNEIKN